MPDAQVADETQQDPESQSPPPAPQLDADALTKELKATRGEAADYRTKLRDAEAKLKEAAEAQAKRDEAEKSELQRAIDRNVKLEQENVTKDEVLQQLRLERAVDREAAKLDIIDPDAAYRLLDNSQVEYDDDGKPTNISDLLAALIEEKPYLVKGEAPPKKGSSTSSTQPATQKAKSPLTRAMIEQMSDDEINANWEEIQKVMATSR